MVSSSVVALVASFQTCQAWQSYVSYNGAYFAMTEEFYNFTDAKDKVWANEKTITVEAGAARCLKHGDDCVGFFREDKDGSADTTFIPATATVHPTGKNADNNNATTFVYYNRSFTPVNGRIRSTYDGLCMEAVPVETGVMKITKEECGPSSFQRWMLNETALVWDGGVGRIQIVAPPKDADWKGAELFVWDATLHELTTGASWDFTEAGQLRLNSKWNHACVFTDEEVSGGMYLWDCDNGPAQQWSLGMMDPWGPKIIINSTNKTNSTNSTPALRSPNEPIKGKIELAEDPESGTGLCLHAMSAENRQQLSLEKCDDATTWEVDYLFDEYQYQLAVAKLTTNGKCITSPNNDRTNGAVLFLWDCEDLGAEEVYYHDALYYHGSGTYTMREDFVSMVKSFKPASKGSLNVYSCADVIGEYVSGTFMQVWDCSYRGENPNQEFVWWNIDEKPIAV